MSFFGSLNVVVGHELIHRRSAYNKFIGQWTMTKILYSHFLDEHLKGHHRTVATAEDPATARMGESLYSFMLRSISGSLTNVWNYEDKSIIKRHGLKAAWWLRIALNKVTIYFVIYAILLGTISRIFGLASLKYHLCYTGVSIMFSEMVNYIEHYGLLRRKDNGIMESINYMHSWNYLSGAVLIRLQRHSDHHAHSFRPYQILRRFDEAPYMPFEYLHCYLFSLIPPLWAFIMDPRV